MKRNPFPLMFVFVLTLAACTNTQIAEPVPPASGTIPESDESATLRSAVIEQIEDDVQARENDAAPFSPAAVGQTLLTNAQAQTGDPGRARMDLLPESTIIRVGPNTLFTVEELMVNDDTPFTRLKLTAGQIWIILLGGSLEVETPVGIAGVRGSLMGVRYDADQMHMAATCLEGDCELKNDLGSTALTTGDAADILGANQAPSSTRPLTTNENVGWLWNNPVAAPYLPRLSETVEVQKDDGTKLAGTFYFADQQTNWIVVLDPMVVGSQDDWITNGFVDWLQGEPGALGAAWDAEPSMPFNVFTYDPTGQGLSGGEPGAFHQEGWQVDALQTAQFSGNYLMGYDSIYKPQPTCHIFVGASTGADRAMLACAASPQSCAGVLSLSPGGYLGVDFADEYAGYRYGAWMEYSQSGNLDMACPAIDPNAGAKVLCVASADDTHSANTCQSVSDANYETRIFSGQGHGTSYFLEPETSAAFGELISGFIEMIVNP